jgi:hypothetical protein
LGPGLDPARVIEQAPKLAIGRFSPQQTCHHSLGEEVHLRALNKDDLRTVTDWLLAGHAHIPA